MTAFKMFIKAKTCILRVADAAIPTHATLLVHFSALSDLLPTSIFLSQGFSLATKALDVPGNKASEKLPGEINTIWEGSSINDKGWQIDTAGNPFLG